MVVTEGVRRLLNGLYVVDFTLPQEEVPKAIEFFQREPSSKILDTILKSTNLLLVFEQSESTSDEAVQLYYSIADQTAVYRVPALEHGDDLDGRLKLKTEYAGLGGGFNWIKVRCPRDAVEKIRQKIQSDIRIGLTYWGRAGSSAWLYSKVKIPEQLASQQLQEAYTQITGDNSFRYLQVIQELKGV